MNVFTIISFVLSLRWGQSLQNYGNLTTASQNRVSAGISTCAPDLSFNLVTSSCVDNETATRISNRPSCKNITLLPEYVDIKDGVLHVTGSGFEFDENGYAIKDDNSVSICYPLTPNFRACERWGVYPNEYRLENGGLKLRLLQSDTVVDTGDFSINAENFGVVCITNSRAKSHVIDAYATSWIISAVSLSISLLIYAVTNRKLTYQTKTMMCHMLSLFIFYLLLVIRAWGPDFSPTVCVVYSVVLHYFFLVSFFWISVLAFDIWKNLPKFASKDVTSTRDRTRFFYMSAYAWGVPVLIAACAAVTDRLAAEDSEFKPHFARQCWFLGLPAKVVFLYGPAAVIIGTNIVFFGMTVWSLKKMSNDAVMVNKKIHAQMTRMYMKLLVVMGLCWIMEIISGVVDKDDRYWYFTDIINGLQGFFLFLVYVCKANVLRDLVSLWTKHVGDRRGLCSKTANTSRVSSPTSENSRENAGSVSSLSLAVSECSLSTTSTQVPNN